MKLSVALVLLATACGGSSSPSPSPMAPAAPPGRAERLQLGKLEASARVTRGGGEWPGSAGPEGPGRVPSIEAYALEDGHLVVPNDGKLLGFGRPPSETAELLAAAGLPRETIALDIQCLLVKANDRVLLFDTGTGVLFGDPGRLPQSLALAGVQPAGVTDIFISHAHGDHVGGLVTKAGALAFPAATIHISAPEWAAFQAETDDASKRHAAAIAPKVAAFAPGAQLLPVVKAVATPGHTPGHSSYQIASDGDQLFYTGDLVHHSVISVQRPSWSIQVDGDHAAAEAMRQQTLARLAADHTRMFVTHFPFPGVGQVATDGPGLVWTP